MPGFERAATIDRPPRQVYAALDDLQGARAWVPALRKVEPLTPGFAVDVGFRWRETRAVWGIFRMSAELEIVEHDAPRTWGARYEDKRLRATTTLRLAPHGGGTLATLQEEVEDLQGKPKRAQRMAQWLEKADGDLLLRLKRHVEAQAPWPADPVEGAEGGDEEAQPTPATPRKRRVRARKAKDGDGEPPVRKRSRVRKPTTGPGNDPAGVPPATEGP